MSTKGILLNSLSVLTAIWLVIPSIAQESSQPLDPLNPSPVEYLSYKARFRLANKDFKQARYYEAIETYESLLAERPDDEQIPPKLAEAYRLVRDYVNAEKWYGYLKMYDAQYHYWYALMLQMNGKYDLALKEFRELKNRADGSKLSSAQWYNVDVQITACMNAPHLINNPLNVSIEHLDTNINGPFTDYAPFIYKDSLLFYSSLNYDSTFFENLCCRDLFISHIYKSHKKDGRWQKGELLPYPVNNGDFSSGNGVFTPDGKRFYFTQCRDFGRLGILCNIWVARHADGVWMEPQILPVRVNTMRHSTTQPAVAAGDDGKDILYFSSDRPGGAGGFDIWYAEISFTPDGKIEASEPKNLGPVINTPGDEITPYYHQPTGRLYFASDMHHGLGGMDIYYSTGSKQTWSGITNLGYPVNSSADDMYFVYGENEDVKYFVSNRPGSIALKHATCCDDIFMAVNNLPPPVIAVTGYIYQYNDESKTPLEGATAFLYDITENDKLLITSQKIEQGKPYYFELKPNRLYEIKVQRAEFFSETIQVSTQGIEQSKTIHEDIGIKKIEKNKAYRLSDIYFEFNSAELTEESKKVLDELYALLMEHPQIIIELSAHTDSKGSDSYNMRLSQRRAESCVNYLISKGIPENRLIARGYGESRPVATNTCINGEDNPAGRALNRRVEFKIIGELTGAELIMK